MKTLTAKVLVEEIAKLGIDRRYEYVSGKNSIQVKRINSPEGPIQFNRLDKNGDPSLGSISPQQLTKIAAICQSKPNYPLHIDRIFSAGGNSRSALEALLVHTPHFFVCNPDRIDVYSGEVKSDLKHIMWCPDDTHELGQIVTKDYAGIINEQEASIDFGEIEVTSLNLGDEFETIDAKRVHVQMQVALVRIGEALNLKTWVAKNDHSVKVGGMRLVDMPSVVSDINEIGLFFDEEIKDAVSMIDCIWLSPDYRNIPAVIEIEHSTGVTSGLTRMLKLSEKFPAIQPTYTVVAPNTMRAKSVSEISQPIFAP